MLKRERLASEFDKARASAESAAEHVPGGINRLGEKIGEQAREIGHKAGQRIEEAAASVRAEVGSEACGARAD